MAKSPHETMLREITAAGDRERTGALDVEWEGAHASLFFLFGHPSHVVFETPDGKTLVGDDALTSLVAELPEDFKVAPWRRAMVPDDTIRLSAEDLLARFTNPPTAADPDEAPAATADATAQTNVADASADAAPVGDAAPVDSSEESAAEAGGAAEGEPLTAAEADTVSPVESRSASEPAGALTADAADTEASGATQAEASAGDPSAGETPAGGAAAPDAAPASCEPAAPPLSLATFPLLKVGTLLFSDAMVNVTRREAVFPLLPDCVMVLTAADHMAAVIVHRRHLVDSVWLTADASMVGEPALAPLMTTDEGQLTAYSIEDDRLVAVLPLLWRGQRSAERLPGAWFDPEVLEAEVAASRRTCAVIVTGPRSGAALFHEGELLHVVATPDASSGGEPATLAGLLEQPGAAVTFAGALDESATAFDRPARRTGRARRAAAVLSLDQARTERVVEPEAPGSIPDHVPTRLAVDLDALRAELTAIAARWLGEEDAAPVADTLAHLAPGVANVVAGVAGIGRMEIPGHEAAVVRAMAREMHYRAAEVLCGV